MFKVSTLRNIKLTTAHVTTKTTKNKGFISPYMKILDFFVVLDTITENYSSVEG